MVLKGHTRTEKVLHLCCRLGVLTGPRSVPVGKGPIDPEVSKRAGFFKKGIRVSAGLMDGSVPLGPERFVSQAGSHAPGERSQGIGKPRSLVCNASISVSCSFSLRSWLQNGSKKKRSIPVDAVLDMDSKGVHLKTKFLDGRAPRHSLTSTRSPAVPQPPSQGRGADCRTG